MNSLSKMQLFVKVVEEQSFSSAARALGLTPSAISRQISQLERELGGRLFQRTTRKQSLTEAGETYFQHVSPIVEDIEAANKAVKHLTGAPSGVLRVTAEADFAFVFLEPLMSEFLALYPQIKLSLNLSSSFDDLVNNNFDLAIRVGHLEDSSLVARKLTESQSIICASPDYIKDHGAVAQPSDLKQHNCLSFRTELGKKNWKFLGHQEELISIPIDGHLQVNDLRFLRNAALNGLGVVMLPSWMVQEHLMNKQLVPLLEAYSSVPESTPVNLIFSSKQYLAPKVRVFIDFLSTRI